ncbi:CCA tRNA nucleotidyltransferase [Thermoproteota archaeon]
MKIPIPPILDSLSHAIQEKGGVPFLVGGCVRDAILGLPIKDFDIEVYCMHGFDELTKILSKKGKVVEVGKAFGILKLCTPEHDYDFSLPRTDVKTGKGYKGFAVTCNPNLEFSEAACRRDFTMNSIGYNLITNEFIDPYNGKKDIENKTIRHINAAFSEDPLRVYRAMQFAGRFEFKIASETISLCQTVDVTELPKERIFEEFRKLFLLSRAPSKGLIYLDDLGISKTLPELHALLNVPQDPEFHPEGDLWTHTLLAVDAMAQLKTGNDEKDLIMMLAALCHDFGKATTTAFKKGHWRSYGHQKEGILPARSFLKSITNEKNLIDQVLILIEHHMAPGLLFREHKDHEISNSAIRRLACKVNIEDLICLAKADYLSRFVKENKNIRNIPFPAGEWLLERAQHLDVKDKKPMPLLKGRHLLELGFKPGEDMGKILEKAFDLQLEGRLTSLDQALDWVKNNYPVHPSS